MNNFFHIPGMLAWQDVRQSYRRSAVGPFWLTIGMSMQIITIGLVFGLIFKTDTREYLPFLATSMVVWGLISTTINEGCSAFINAEAMIKQLQIPQIHHVVRVVWRNLIVAGHNVVILPPVFLFFLVMPNWTLVALVPGALLLVLNLTWLVWLLGMGSARFRDLSPIVNSAVTIAFYLTPVMWYPKLIDNDSLAHFLLGLNPLYHVFQVVRLPILGQWPTLENWGVTLLCAAVGWTATMIIARKFKNMIAYWV